MSNRPTANWFEEDMDAAYDTLRGKLIKQVKDTLIATKPLELKLQLFRTVVEQAEDDEDLETRIHCHLDDPETAGNIQIAINALEELKTLSLTYHTARYIHRRAKSALDEEVQPK